MPERASANDLLRLNNLFDQKNWSNNVTQEEVFNSMSILLDNMSANERELMFELIGGYLWVTGSEYEGYLNRLFNHIAENYDLSACSKIYLVPVMKVSDRKRVKSSSHCVYLVDGILKFITHYRDFEIEILNNYYRLASNKFANDGSELIFLIDDFIGTGDTFADCWRNLSKNPTITEDNSLLAAMVIQQSGLDFINASFNIPVFWNLVTDKGISDRYASPTREEKAGIMDGIEKYCAPGSYSFGYHRSEALVSMLKTPNNTFPIFWKKSTIRRRQFYPPFPR
jgi:hypothetical protein